MATLSTMLLTYMTYTDILAQKWHQLQVTSNGTKRWYEVFFGNWKNYGKVPNYPSLRKF